MRVNRVSLALAAAVVLAGAGCYTTTGYTRTYGEGAQSGRGYPGAWEKRGKVGSIRENVERAMGDPAGGAVAGALIGGVLTGKPGGALLGAFFGAAASSGSVERRQVEVFIDFDDGTRQAFSFQGYPPFQVGDRVVVTDRGIFRE